MARLLTLTCVLLACTALSAQADDREPVVVEMKIERSLDAESNGVADLLDQVQADRLILYYTLQNSGADDLNIAPEVRIADEVNCAAVVTQRPEEHVAAGAGTPMVIEVTPKEPGPLSFSVNMIVNDADYAFPVQSTVTVVLHDEYTHCHDGSCHTHHDDHHHCSTGESSNWLMLGSVTAALAAVMLRRRAR
jgi:hypothetical protein